MIGLDTNVVVRYLAQDDAVQSARATLLFERELTRENPGFISIIAMVEMVWVLQRSYRASAQKLAEAIEALLSSDVLVVECEQEVFGAAVSLRAGEASFADALIAELGIRAGCSTTLTFDAGALRLPGFTKLGSRRSR